MRRALKDLLAFLLGDASQNAKRFALCPQLLIVGETVEDFLLGLISDRAGVIEDQIRGFDRFYLAITLLLQRADDLLRVMHVHLAAEGFEVERL